MPVVDWLSQALLYIKYMLGPYAQGLYGSWKSWKVLEFLFWHFPRLESRGKLMQVLESPGNLL